MSHMGGYHYSGSITFEDIFSVGTTSAYTKYCTPTGYHIQSANKIIYYLAPCCLATYVMQTLNQLIIPYHW